MRRLGVARLLRRQLFAEIFFQLCDFFLVVFCHDERTAQSGGGKTKNSPEKRRTGSERASGASEFFTLYGLELLVAAAATTHTHSVHAAPSPTLSRTGHYYTLPHIHDFITYSPPLFLFSSLLCFSLLPLRQHFDCFPLAVSFLFPFSLFLFFFKTWKKTFIHSFWCLPSPKIIKFEKLKCASHTQHSPERVEKGIRSWLAAGGRMRSVSKTTEKRTWHLPPHPPGIFFSFSPNRW